MANTDNSRALQEQSPKLVQARFGELVRKIREERGLTQLDVALKVYGKASNVSSVSDLERGRSEPQATTVANYCAALAIPEEDVDACRQKKYPNCHKAFWTSWVLPMGFWRTSQCGSGTLIRMQAAQSCESTCTVQRENTR